ncbi:hypothetical protein [Henriciella aquimarina]|uniref:hypothetical protein n=1 Tax=Henriciella aquimarina TaxID=545261 RepID=UPI0009FDACDC|nr:hypothetical protein [Henriciella aquimarina]
MKLAGPVLAVLITATVCSTAATAEVTNMNGVPEIGAGFESPVDFPECSLSKVAVDSVDPNGDLDLVFVCDEQRGWAKLDGQLVELVEIGRSANGHDQTRLYADPKSLTQLELVLSTAGQTDAFLVLEETQAMPPENRRTAKICYASLRIKAPVQDEFMDLQGVLLSGADDV